MAIKRTYKEQKDIPAAFAALFVEKGGEWVLELEGGDGADVGKLTELRATGAALKQELEALRAKYEGVDLEEVRKLAAEKKRLEEEAQLKAGEVDKVIAARVTAVKGDLEKQLQAAAAEREALTARLSAIQIDQAVMSEAGKRGLRGTAGPDIMGRARNVFRLVGGVPVSFEADGKTTRVGKDGVTPMTVAEWIEGQVTEAPHLFEGNAGSGAAGGAGNNGARSGGNGINPFRKESWNLTEQMRLQKTDPALAARLKSAAGAQG